MVTELRAVVADFERLWAVPGFAQAFAASLAAPAAPAAPAGPDGAYDLVLAEHHRLLVAALRRARRHGRPAAGRDLDDLADALVGFYLGRRLRRAADPNRCQGWVGAAIDTIVGAGPPGASQTEAR